jgi:hypothetical protein
MVADGEVDALRRPERFEELLLACECDARGRAGMEERPYPVADRLRSALRAMQGVDTAAVAQHAAERGWSGPAVGEAIRRARIQAVAQALGEKEQVAGAVADFGDAPSPRKDLGCGGTDTGKDNEADS